MSWAGVTNLAPNHSRKITRKDIIKARARRIAASKNIFIGLGDKVAIADPLSYLNPDDADKINSLKVDMRELSYKPWLFHHHHH